jgi:prophage regulatory protein
MSREAREKGPASSEKRSISRKVMFPDPCPKFFASPRIGVMLDLHSMSADPNPRTILRIEAVFCRSGLKRTMLYDLIAKGLFPKQVPLGARAVGWYEDEVDEWVRNRDSANRHPERPVQAVTDKEEEAPANKLLPRGARKAPTVNPVQPKPTAAFASTPPAPPSVVRTTAAGRRPTPGINIDDDEVEAINESEELRLLRKENAQLKKLVGELVLKNSLLQASAGLKASNL